MLDAGVTNHKLENIEAETKGGTHCYIRPGSKKFASSWLISRKDRCVSIILRSMKKNANYQVDYRCRCRYSQSYVTFINIPMQEVY